LDPEAPTNNDVLLPAMRLWLCGCEEIEGDWQVTVTVAALLVTEVPHALTTT